MGLALYRKYRPKTFAEVTGQNHIKVTLENELRNGTVAHAYLMTGQRGVGKTTLARIFAKAANCLERKQATADGGAGESEPCNHCAACTEQNENRSLDVIEIDAASNTGVDNVRENIIEHVRFAPTSRKYKVFIVDEVHMLSTSAWNALLKTLEEPPAHAMFIMATTEVHKVPATILSRCQRFDFKRIPPAEMIKRLTHLAVEEGVKVDPEVLHTIVHQSDGCLRDAESTLEQVLSLGEKHIDVEAASLVLPRSNADLVRQFVDTLAARQSTAGIMLVNRLVEEGVDLGQFAGEAVEYLRMLLLLKLGAPQDVIDTEATKHLGAAHLARMIDSMLSARVELKTAPIPQLPLELVVAAHCGDPSPNVTVSPPVTIPASAPVIASPAIGGASPDESPRKKQSQHPSIPLESLALRWDELCAHIQEENPSLPFLLRVAKPIRYEDGELIIGVQYKMHAEKLNAEKNRATIQRGLTLLYDGASISVRAEQIDDAGIESTTPDPLTNNLLQQFGGTVVE